MYDYTLGKADWLAAGLPTTGKGGRPSRAIDAIDSHVPTCTPDERIVDVAARLGDLESPVCVVINDRRVVQGRLRVDRVDRADTRTAGDVMEPGPATIRADADLAQTRERMTSRNATSLIVTTPEGVLLGLLQNRPGRQDDGGGHPA